MCSGSASDSKLVIGSGDPSKYGFDPLPAAPPDYTSKDITDVAAAQRLMLQAKRGRASTFLTGPEGLTTGPKLGRTLLGG